ncbi:type III-B CRISPR module RAMP protein Cmr4 [Desulfurococcaceae archaeon AG1]|jgi:CRISPR-associated protein Cmr4|nr:type III-B CRISPR module RAMP protein Cmr4 [Desulfurococcaceae archaeon AG1]HWQ17599.1 type III-B CRISPR module RAMP protein Cmr4 [Sulfolobales archaeon]
MSEGKLIISPYEISEIALIRAVTNLHPGVGRSGETVDLPVQRDGLGFPIIYSSSLKGALKSVFWNLPNVDKNEVRDLFGPDPDDGEKFTSAVALLDALVIVFPVRSLEGVYAFATSPLLLKRFRDYLELTGSDYECVRNLSNLSINKGTCQTSKQAVDLLGVKALGGRIIINEEIDVSCNTDLSNDIEALEKLLNIEKGRLLILSDDEALDALNRSLVRVTRIAVDREKKTVKERALWTEEYIPSSTVFTTVFLYSYARRSGSSLGSPDNVKNKFHELLGKTKNYLIIGGNETIGRGIVKLEFVKKGA